MMEYKRLTGQEWSENIDLKQELGYSYIYKRLYELETKIEQGTLIEIPENAVVLTREEYDKIRYLADECIEWRRKNCNVGELPKENAVVLTREEYNELCCSIGVSREEVDRVVDMVEKDTRKETAEKFAEKLKNELKKHELRGWIELATGTFNMFIDEICKEMTEGE